MEDCKAVDKFHQSASWVLLFLLDCIEAANEEFLNLNNYILFPSTAGIIHFLFSIC